MADPARATYYSTSARVTGAVGIVLAVGLAVLSVVGAGVDLAPWGFALLAFLVVVAWVAMIRPTLTVADGSLVLRQMTETVTVPAALVEEIDLRSILRLQLVDGRHFDTAAVGRTRRQIRSDSGSTAIAPRLNRLEIAGRVFGAASKTESRRSYGWHVEDMVKSAVQRSRDGASGEPGDVTRARAWPEIAALVVTAVATVVLIFV